MLHWHKHTSRQILAFGLTMGREHMEERTAARDFLDHLHEMQPHRYPRVWVCDVWEELWWRWWEELKAELRKLLREMQTETPTKEELKFYALAPSDSEGGPRLQMPTTFQVNNSESYYRVVIEPRVERSYDRRMWDQVWGKTAAPKELKLSLIHI